MNQEKPRLMDLPSDGSASKPEELEGKPITITDAITTRMPDGRESAKWVVQHTDGTTQVYWAAGQNPTLQVRDWFRRYPGQPLHCRLFRQQNQYGTQVWHIEQREEGDTTSGDATRAAALDAQLSEVGL